MHQLPFMTTEGIQRLQAWAKDNPKAYYTGAKPSQRMLQQNRHFKDSSIPWQKEEFQSLFNQDEDWIYRPQGDRNLAWAVYRTLQSLTPAQAGDERLWVYLCHFEAYEYIGRRWLKATKSKAMANTVLERFFGSNRRAIISRNGLSRLWWLGYIAKQVHNEPKSYIDAVLSKQDVYANIFERPSLVMNPRIHRVAAERIVHAWRIQDGLLERNRFRAWMQRMNLKGGQILLDALDENTLREMVLEEADNVLASQ